MSKISSFKKTFTGSVCVIPTGYFRVSHNFFPNCGVYAPTNVQASKVSVLWYFWEIKEARSLTFFFIQRKLFSSLHRYFPSNGWLCWCCGFRLHRTKTKSLKAEQRIKCAAAAGYETVYLSFEKAMLCCCTGSRYTMLTTTRRVWIYTGSGLLKKSCRRLILKSSYCHQTDFSLRQNFHIFFLRSNNVICMNIKQSDCLMFLY